MRRLILPLMFSSAAIALLAACEDGPTQVYSPSPPGAATTWNNSNAPGSTGDAGKDFNGAGTAGQNANIICNPEKKKAVWSNMLKQPFYPPSVGGNLDIAGGVDGVGGVGKDPIDTATRETWTGLNLDQAEQINCQSTFAGDAYGDGSFFYASWGDNGEVQAFYRVSNRQIYTVYLTSGYLGQMDAKSRDGKDTFTIKIDGSTLLKNNAAFIINWADIPTRNAQVNEIYDALTSTYSALGKETDCVKSGHCIVNNFGDQGAYMWFTPLGFTITVQTTNGDPKVGSTPIYVSQDKKKLLGYSFADILLQFDNAGTGPTATQKNVFGSGKDCNVRMDMPFSEFRDNCVAPSTDAAKNKIEMAKLFGGFGHGDETFSFDVAGVDPNFAPLQPQSLKDNDVVRDGDRPVDGDPITSLRIDQESGGQIRNDFTNNDASLGPQGMDWHGSGMVMLEWAYNAETWFHNYNVANGLPAKATLGDPICLTGTPAQQAAEGCTGLEGIVTAASPSIIDAATLTANPSIKTNALGAAITKKFGGLSIGLKPAAWHSYFCTDSTKPSTCVGDSNSDSFFATAYAQLVKVAGGGNAGNLPTEARDVRFLFKQWIFALVKYMQVAENPAATFADMNAATIDENNLFFDAVGSGQFEIAEYIDRHNANKGQDPIDLNFTVDVLHGIFNDYTFVRHLRRGESLLYQATREVQTDHLGYENSGMLSSFAGSKVLAAAYPSYECAINTDPHNAHCANAPPPPMDANGNFLTFDNGDLILKPYPGAWGQSPFTVGTFSDMSIDTASIDPFIQSAMISIPIHKDPFDPSTDLLDTGKKLIPYLPKGAAVGFNIEINGQQDKFIETYQADFSGVTISANVDYDYAVNPATGNKGIQIKGIETTDFLGEVFPCQDAATGDLLRVRMYTSAKSILDWFAAHPGTAQACGMIFRYSPYGNYLDFITSTTNGIRLSINPGAGGGRVVDAVVFDPTVVGL